MTDAPEQLPRDVEEDGLYGERRWRISYVCDRCGHEWNRITRKLGGKDPPCPVKACRQAATEEQIEREVQNRMRMLESQTPPGVIGNNVQVKAVDTTAEIVMQDYGMTNLQDNVRMGDSVAPKLPPHQQVHADNFFGGGRMGTQRARKLQRLGQRAIAGAFRDYTPSPGQIVQAKAGEPPLRLVGTEKIRE